MSGLEANQEHDAALNQKGTDPSVSIIIPVFNEAAALEEVLAHLFAAPCPIRREWIVVDDKSTDGSTEILRELQPKYGYRLLEQDPNQGKGSAVRRGIREATGDFVIIQDADFEYDPADIPSLLEPLIQNRADVVYGSRFKSSHQVRRTYHYFVNRLLTVLSNLLSGIYLTDMETCYKAFRRDLVQSMALTSERFGIEVEFTAFIAKLRARIYELPISYYPRTQLQGKKINWKDGVAALWHLVHFNWLTSLEEAFDLTRLPPKYFPSRDATAPAPRP